MNTNAELKFLETERTAFMRHMWRQQATEAERTATLTAALVYVSTMNPLELANFAIDVLRAGEHPKAHKIERILERWAENYELQTPY